MGRETAGRRGPARKLDRAAQLHVTLPESLADRLKESAARLHVSRSLLAREAIERGIKPATDALRAKVRRMRDASTDTNGGAQRTHDRPGLVRDRLRVVLVPARPRDGLGSDRWRSMQRRRRYRGEGVP